MKKALAAIVPALGFVGILLWYSPHSVVLYIAGGLLIVALVVALLKR